MSQRPHLVALATALALAACGGGDEDARPAATGPTVVASPSPSPAAAKFVCPLPSLPDHHQPCPKETPVYSDGVNAAIDRTLDGRPQLFDFADNIEGTAFKVKDKKGYIAAVTEELNKLGFCVAESPEELGIKKDTNAFNEQWNIISSDDRVRRKYVTTCYPAAF